MHTKTLLSVAGGSYKTIPIVSQICVKDGYAYATDVDHSVAVPCTLENGMYYHETIKVGEFIKSSLPIEDFPEVQICKEDYKGIVTMGLKEINALRWVLAAASDDECRYYLQGVYFDLDGVVATNGHVLHGFDFKPNYKPDVTHGEIIDKGHIKTILDLYYEVGAGTISIEIFEGRFICSINDCVVKGKTINGSFPDWRRVVPEYEKSTEFNCKEFTDIKDLVKAFHRISGGGGESGVTIGNKTIRANYSPDDVNAEWPTTIDLPHETGFNLKYICGLPSGKLYYPSAIQGSYIVDPLVLKSDYAGVSKFAAIMPLRK